MDRWTKKAIAENKLVKRANWYIGMNFPNTQDIEMLAEALAYTYERTGDVEDVAERFSAFTNTVGLNYALDQLDTYIEARNVG